MNDSDEKMTSENLEKKVIFVFLLWDEDEDFFDSLVDEEEDEDDVVDVDVDDDEWWWRDAPDEWWEWWWGKDDVGSTISDVDDNKLLTDPFVSEWSWLRLGLMLPFELEVGIIGLLIRLLLVIKFKEAILFAGL